LVLGLAFGGHDKRKGRGVRPTLDGVWFSKFRSARCLVPWVWGLLAGPSEARDGRGERTGMYSQRVPQVAATPKACPTTNTDDTKARFTNAKKYPPEGGYRFYSTARALLHAKVIHDALGCLAPFPDGRYHQVGATHHV